MQPWRMARLTVPGCGNIWRNKYLQRACVSSQSMAHPGHDRAHGPDLVHEKQCAQPAQRQSDQEQSDGSTRNPHSAPPEILARPGEHPIKLIRGQGSPATRENASGTAALPNNVGIRAQGFGTTIGNALRRIMLSSIEGAAITAVRVEGVLHEFSPIPGAVEGSR